LAERFADQPVDERLGAVLDWLVAELGGDALMVTDARGEVVLANARAESLFAYERNALVGVPIDSLLPRRRDAELAGASDPAVDPAARLAITQGLRRARRADGTHVDVRVEARAVTTRRGRFAVVTVRAVSADEPLGDDAGAQPDVDDGITVRFGRVLVVGPVDVTPGSIVDALTAGGFETETVTDAPSARRALESELADVVVIDVDRFSRFDVLDQVRTAGRVPVVVVSGRDDENDRVEVLRLGADDYLTKPFSPAELVERVRAVLRRVATVAREPSLRFGEVDIDLDARLVTVSGRDLQLSPIEFDLIVFFARNPRRVFSRAQLLRHVWGSSADWQTEATVTEHVRRLRRKMESVPDARRRIITVQRAGYRFDP